ncbi:Frataxin, mitochondrial [Linum perenne]
MASTKLLLPLRRFYSIRIPSSRSPLLQASGSRCTRFTFGASSAISAPSRSLCSRSPTVDGNFPAPAAIDYRNSSILQENEFHELADSTIHDLQEKLEEYGDTVQVDGFDIDYGNEVLTLKLGS